MNCFFSSNGRRSRSDPRDLVINKVQYKESVYLELHLVGLTIRSVDSSLSSNRKDFLDDLPIPKEFSHKINFAPLFCFIAHSSLVIDLLSTDS